MTLSSTQPLVTVGLPVYNGTDYLRQCIRSVLGQTFSRFELIIRDNASTDQTESICREFAESDHRVRYIRSASNIGAAPNFNALVSEARGQYFKWIAHDDIIAPQFLSSCVAALENDQQAVLACPRVRFIDAHGEMHAEYTSSARTDHPERVVRFRDLLSGHPCFEVFGLIRLADLKSTNLIGGYYHGDGVLLAHLALMGKFAVIKEDHFLSRIHEGQSMYRFGLRGSSTQIDFDAYARWMSAHNSSNVSRSFTKNLREYLWMIRNTRISVSERWACYGHVFKWALPKWRCIAGEWKRTILEWLGFDGTSRHIRTAKSTDS